MLTCHNCGSEIDNNNFCKYCGVGVGDKETLIITSEPYGIVYLLLGLIIPILGVAGYFYLRKTKQKQAKALGVGALLYFMFFGYGSILFIILMS